MLDAVVVLAAVVEPGLADPELAAELGPVNDRGRLEACPVATGVRPSFPA